MGLALTALGVSAPTETEETIRCAGLKLGDRIPFVRETESKIQGDFGVVTEFGVIVEIGCFKKSRVEVVGRGFLRLEQAASQAILLLGQPDEVSMLPLQDDTISEFVYYKKYKLGMLFSHDKVASIQIMDVERWHQLPIRHLPPKT